MPYSPVQDDVTRARPFAELDPRRIRAAFFDLFGRPPLLSERETWAGKGLVTLLDARLGDEGFWKHWLQEQLYYFLLIDNFRPRSERLIELPANLAASKLDIRDAIWRVALSSSFDLRNPGADTFVTVVMEQLLGITVQKQARELEIGKAAYDGREGLFLGKRAGSQSDVVAIAMQDKRFCRRFVEREHERILRCAPAKKASAGWARALHKDPGEYLGIVRSWFLSEAWEQRLARPRRIPNRAWVAALFVDVYDRVADEDEARRMRDALDGLSDPLPLRGLLTRLLLDAEDSPLPAKQSVEDVTGWVRERFRLLLGREPDAEEARTFVHAFRDPACRPSTVVYALMASAEYHDN